jgi:hypothetical protein
MKEKKWDMIQRFKTFEELEAFVILTKSFDNDKITLAVFENASLEIFLDVINRGIIRIMINNLPDTSDETITKVRAMSEKLMPFFVRMNGSYKYIVEEFNKL